MLTYSANFVPLPPFTCPACGGQPSSTIGALPICNHPCAPRLQQILLPSSGQLPGSSPDGGIFPLDILSVLSLPRQLDLWDIELRTPIHLHATGAHIGTLTGAFPGQVIQALDVFLFLQDFAKKPIDYHRTFSTLPHHIQKKVNGAFRTRCTQALSRHARTAWQLFVSDQHAQRDRGPLGVDLLLGNSEVWGFEDRSYNGYSIVHLSGGRIDA